MHVLQHRSGLYRQVRGFISHHVTSPLILLVTTLATAGRLSLWAAMIIIGLGTWRFYYYIEREQSKTDNSPKPQ